MYTKQTYHYVNQSTVNLTSKTLSIVKLNQNKFIGTSYNALLNDWFKSKYFKQTMTIYLKATLPLFHPSLHHRHVGRVIIVRKTLFIMELSVMCSFSI